MKKLLPLLIILLLATPAEAKILGFKFYPDSSLYFLEGVTNTLEGLFAFSSEQKAYVAMNNANEKLEEIEYLQNKGGDITPLLEQVENEFNYASKFGKEISNLARQKQFEEKLTLARNHHTEVLNTISNKHQTQTKAKIKTTINNIQSSSDELSDEVEERNIRRELLLTKLNTFMDEVEDEYDGKTWVRCPDGLNEVLSLRVFDSEGIVIWEGKAKIEDKVIDINPSDNPTITISISEDYIYDVLERRNRGEEIEQGEIINAIRDGRITISPITKVIYLVEKYTDLKVEI